MHSDSSVAERATGHLDFASWLSDDLLLAVGWFPTPESRLEATFQAGDTAVPAEARVFSYPRPDMPCADLMSGKIMTVRLLRPVAAGDRLGVLTVRDGFTTLLVSSENMAEEMRDLQVLLRSSLAAVPDDVRTDVLEFLGTTLQGHGGTMNAVKLSKNLLRVREELRAHMTVCNIAENQPQGLSVDALLAIDHSSFYIRGWLQDAESQVTALTAVSPTGERVELLKQVFHFQRPDIEKLYKQSSQRFVKKHGFIGYFETKVPHYVQAGWLVEMRNADGHACEVAAPRAVDDPILVRETLLADFAFDPAPAETLLGKHLGPALIRLREQNQPAADIEEVKQFGHPPEAPEVSIVVPLYNRIDFLEQQMAQFVHDPEMRAADLIYVLDSPELAASLRTSAAQLYRLYGIPFRVALLRESSGYSAANNAGASLANSPLLLLLNSDVLPDEPGWLGTMSRFYDATPDVGALGAKLLFEDDTLQHAGMYFSKAEGETVWDIMHYFKGMHGSLPAGNKARPVPAVTGACLMIDRALYQEMGGLRGTYIQGDCEDSDFCLRLVQAGYQNWYLPTAQLYHLEGQSYPLPLRQATSRFNRWLHTQLWGGVIEAVMAGQSKANGAHPPSRKEPKQKGAQLRGSRRNKLAETKPSPKVEPDNSVSPDAIKLYLQSAASTLRGDDVATRWIADASGAVIAQPAPRKDEAPAQNGEQAAKPAGQLAGGAGNCDLETSLLRRCVDELREEAERREKTIAELQRSVAHEQMEKQSSEVEHNRLMTELFERFDNGQQTVQRDVAVVADAVSEQRAQIGKLDQVTARIDQLETMLRGSLTKVERKSADLFRATLTANVRRITSEILPEGSTVAIVSKGDGEIVNIAGRTGWHFPQAATGVYAGHHPADSAAATAHLEELRAKGAEYLLFPRSAFWWFDQYADFKGNLDKHHRVAWNDSWCVIYELSKLKKRRVSTPALVPKRAVRTALRQRQPAAK